MADRKCAIRNETRIAANNKDAWKRCEQCKHEKIMQKTLRTIEIEIAKELFRDGSFGVQRCRLQRSPWISVLAEYPFHLCPLAHTPFAISVYRVIVVGRCASFVLIFSYFNVTAYRLALSHSLECIIVVITGNRERRWGFKHFVVLLFVKFHVLTSSLSSVRICLLQFCDHSEKFLVTV